MDYYPYEILEDSPMTHPAIAEAARNLICGEGLYDYDATDLERATSIITAAVERVLADGNTGVVYGLQRAKWIYREKHSGGCSMPSLGDECDCFLCRVDRECIALQKGTP
jgi:hypothetical protein